MINFPLITPFFKKEKSQVFFFFLILLLSLFLFIFITGFGLSSQVGYWYGSGVPILGIQIVESLVVGVAFSWILYKTSVIKNNINLDVFLFVLVWVVCSYIWGAEPLRSSFFMTDTGSNPIFPYSDSATFDIGSQYAIIGQGVFNGQYFDRLLYPAFLTYLHAATGQNINNLMVFQSILYSVFPAIAYLLGRELRGRVLGITLASLLILRGVNSIIGTSLIDMAGPKMMLTDFPTAIGVSLILFLLLKWLKKPNQVSGASWAGAAIGFTLLLRTHALLLLPFIIIFLWFYFINGKRIIGIYGSVLLIIGMLISTLPLDIQNQKKGVPFFYMYYSRIELVLKARYGIKLDSNSSVPEKKNTISFNEEHSRVRIQVNTQRQNCYAIYCVVINHFAHNFLTSFLYLPSSFEMADFRTTVKRTAPYWQRSWVGGDMNIQNYLLIFINIIISSVGAGVIWTRTRAVGLLPLWIFLVYLLSNSLALTSGGRYITPVDWIVCIYYIAGLLGIGDWLLQRLRLNIKLLDEDSEASSDLTGFSPQLSYRGLIGAFLAIFMIGSLIPAADYLFPVRYPERTTQGVLVLLDQKGLMETAGLNRSEVEGFLNNPNARLTYGRLLYPRFYPSNKGEPGSEYPYKALDYRRLAFTVIGPFKLIPEGVILPMEHSVPGLHALDVAVLGCKNRDFLDALVVFILSEPQQVFIRPTGVTLQCPLPGP